MAVAGLSSTKLSFLNFDSALEQSSTERFLKENFSLAVVDGRHRHLCSQKLISSWQPGTE